MLSIDRCVTKELLEIAFDRVQRDIDATQPGDPSLDQIRNFAKSSRLKKWALDSAVDFLAFRKSPDVAQATLGLLTAGILVGMELQRLAGEVGALEDWYGEEAEVSVVR
ncbi:MAG TPA: hypothetical protein VG204_11635 [Terriglobia bacterium]|nr:hypothetical protein [Terriglobia bacterium]